MKIRNLLLALTISSAAAALAWYYQSQPVNAAAYSNLPTAVARQGEFSVITTCRGELVADKSVLITAPLNVPDLRIVWQAEAGAGPEEKSEPTDPETEPWTVDKTRRHQDRRRRQRGDDGLSDEKTNQRQRPDGA